MKPRIFLLTTALAGPMALLTGCVGYNTALFMTKSNAGLDLDLKPPTAEINISRKEGVVEPSFEGGKTPPVMASFSAKTGTDGVSRFLFGVNQTFSGGNAANTMAVLYDTTNAPTAAQKELFDSGITLSEPPTANSKKGILGWRKKLFGLAEAGEVRPFFFGTDSQLGVKIGWNGVGGPYPDTVKAGFNRKEIAIAPVTISEDNEVRIPSFLATVDTDVKSSSSNNVKVGWMQYFATGASAEQLAQQFGVRKAMLERTDPKAMAAQDKKFRTFKDDLTKQRDAFIEIEKSFKSGNTERQAGIIDQAKLVFGLAEDTNATNLLKRLSLKKDGKPESTNNFESLLEKIKL